MSYNLHLTATSPGQALGVKYELTKSFGITHENAFAGLEGVRFTSSLTLVSVLNLPNLSFVSSILTELSLNGYKLIIVMEED